MCISVAVCDQNLSFHKTFLLWDTLWFLKNWSLPLPKYLDIYNPITWFHNPLVGYNILKTLFCCIILWELGSSFQIITFIYPVSHLPVLVLSLWLHYLLIVESSWHGMVQAVWSICSSMLKPNPSGIIKEWLLNLFVTPSQGSPTICPRSLYSFPPCLCHLLNFHLHLLFLLGLVCSLGNFKL